jgi:SAM-dependent methyltransferase
MTTVPAARAEPARPSRPAGLASAGEVAGSDTAAAVFPEAGAGGYSRMDGSVEFWARVNAVLPPDAVVVDLGAGRGKFLEDPAGFRRWLHDLKPRCARMIGLDVDPAVRHNTALHESHVINPSGRFPLADASVDVLVSDWTFEHVTDPAHTAAEIDRVLRPGGWLCARTPRKWGAVGIPTMLVPNRLHTAVLRRLQPGKRSRDTFPTAYRLNSHAALRRWFPVERFAHHVYAYDAEPSYVGSSPTAMRAGLAMQRLLPARAASTLMIFIRKRETA